MYLCFGGVRAPNYLLGEMACCLFGSGNPAFQLEVRDGVCRGVPCKGLILPGIHVFTQWLQFPPTVQRHADYRSTGNATAPVGVNVFVSLHAFAKKRHEAGSECYELFHFMYFHAILESMASKLSPVCHYVLIRNFHSNVDSCFLMSHWLWRLSDVSYGCQSETRKPKADPPSGLLSICFNTTQFCKVNTRAVYLS